MRAKRALFRQRSASQKALRVRVKNVTGSLPSCSLMSWPRLSEKVRNLCAQLWAANCCQFDKCAALSDCDSFSEPVIKHARTCINSINIKQKQSKFTQMHSSRLPNRMTNCQSAVALEFAYRVSHLVIKIMHRKVSRTLDDGWILKSGLLATPNSRWWHVQVEYAGCHSAYAQCWT